MNNIRDSKFEQLRAQLGIKVTQPSFDTQSGIAQTWENTQHDIRTELDSFNEIWESRTSQDDFRTSMHLAIENLSQHEFDESDTVIQLPKETANHQYKTNSTESNKNSVPDTITSEPFSLENLIDKNFENIDCNGEGCCINDVELTSKEGLNREQPHTINDFQTVEPPKTDFCDIDLTCIEQSETKSPAEKSSEIQPLPPQPTQETPQLVITLLEDVTRQLSDSTEQVDTDPAKNNVKSTIEKNQDTDSQPTDSQQTSPEQTETQSSSSIPQILTKEVNSTKNSKKKSKKNLLKGIGFFFITKILIVVVAYLIITVFPTYQINKQICGLSDLTIKLDNVSRNYRSGVTMVDSISALDSENKLVYKTGKATFSGLSLFSTKQIHLDSAWIEDIEFIPNATIPVCDNIKVTNTVSSLIHADNKNSDISIAQNDTSEYLFVEYTTQYLTRFLTNFEQFCTWLPADINQSLKSTDNPECSQAIVSANNTKAISIDKLHLSGNTVFMGKPTIFTIEIDNYSSRPTNKPMTIELAFGTNRSGTLTVEVVRRETGSELTISCHKADTNNRFSFGKLHEFTVFQNAQKVENCLENCDIVMTISRGRVQGELTMTQKVAKAQLTFHGIDKPVDVQKLEGLVANLDKITVHDTFEGLYSKPVHHVQSNLDSLGQSIADISKGSYLQSIETPSMNNELADVVPTNTTSPETILNQTESEVSQSESEIKNDNNSKVVLEELVPTVTLQVKEDAANTEEPQNLAERENVTKEQTQEDNEIELTISDSPNVPLTAPNSPAIGNQTESVTRSATTPPPLPVFVSDEDENDNNIETVNQDDPPVTFTLGGRSKK